MFGHITPPNHPIRNQDAEQYQKALFACDYFR